MIRANDQAIRTRIGPSKFRRFPMEFVLEAFLGPLVPLSAY